MRKICKMLLLLVASIGMFGTCLAQAGTAEREEWEGRGLEGSWIFQISFQRFVDRGTGSGSPQVTARTERRLRRLSRLTAL